MLEQPAKVPCWGMVSELAKDEYVVQQVEEHHVDVHTPKKVQLPVEALPWGACQEPYKDDAPLLLGRTPCSPAPALPPSLPPSLWASEQLVPPPVSPAAMMSFSLAEALCGPNMRDSGSPSLSASPAGPPCSPPPPLRALALPASLPLSPPPAAAGSPASTAPEKLGLPAEAFGWGAYCEATPEPTWLLASTPGSSGAKATVKLSQLLAWGSAAGDSSQEDEEEPVRAGRATRQGQLELGPDASPSARFPPGLEPPQGSPSHGSALHGTGHCRPCAWFWKAQGCQNELDCGHCHLCPAGEIKARKKAKRTIMRMGLATPKVEPGAELQAARALGTVFQQEALAPSEAESTAAPGSDQASTTGISGSEQELAAGSEQGSPRAEGTQATKSHTESPVEPPPGLLPQSLGNAQSAGSVLHGTGNCRPCAWFWKPVGCQSGHNCAYCHECPEGAVKARKKCKQAMMRMGLSTPKTALAGKEQAMYGFDAAALP